MDEKIVFVRTSIGEDEARSRTALLSKDIKRALLMVDGAATVAEIKKRASPSLRSELNDMFTELVKDGFIQDKARAVRSAKLVKPAPPKKSTNEVEELDFTAAFSVPTRAVLAEEAAKLRAADEAREEIKRKNNIAEERARLEAAEVKSRELAKAEKAAAEAARLDAERHAREAAEAVRMAEQRAQKVKAEAEARARVEAEEKNKLEAEVSKLKAKAEAEAQARAKEQARLEAEKAERREAALRAEAEKTAAKEAARRDAERHAREAAEAIRRAEQHVEKVKAEAQARARAVAEEKDKLEAEVAKLKAQAEAQAQARVEERARLEAEKAERREAALRAKAEKAAAVEAARLEAELQAEKIRAEAEQAKAEVEARARVVAEEKARLEAEVARLKAQAEAEALAKREAEAARIKAEQEAERIKAEQEAERIKAEQEAERIKAEQEAERIKAEQEAERIKAEQEAERIKAEQEAARIKAEQEAERIKAEQEAERIKAEQEAARIKAEQEAERIKAEQEAARIKAEQEAERIKAEQEAARIKAEQEAERIKAEQEAERIKAEQEAERIKAEQETERIKEAERHDEVLASVVRLNAKHAAIEESVLLALDESVQQLMSEQQRDSAGTSEGMRERRVVSAVLSGCDSRGGNNGVPVVERRTTTAAVLFLDIVGYTKQSDSKQLELKKQFNQLLTDSLSPLGSGERIMLDTGDGAAIGFLQHPTDALESAVHFRTDMIANKHYDYPELRVRVGIHLGPVSLVKDMNGQMNMLGDGINSAQRVMSFAGLDQIFVSRAYFDFVSSMSDEYDDLFRYRGSQQDKHGREHQVYELVDGEEVVNEIQVPADESSDELAAFNFEAFDVPGLPKAELPQSQPAEILQSDAAEQLLMDTIALGQSVEAEPVVEEPVDLALEEAETYSGADAVQLADVQAKKWLEAEQRAIELARERAESTAYQRANQPAGTARVAKSQRRSVPWGKLVVGLLVLFAAALFAVPAVLPMQDYVPNIEQLIGSTLRQPVHIGRLSGRILPSPRLVLSDVSIGNARQIQVGQAQVNFSFADLFGQVKPVTHLDLAGVAVKGTALPEVTVWLQQVAANPAYPIARITLVQGKLDAEGMQLSDVDGELNFVAAGKFAQAHLNALGHKLALDIHAADAQKLALSVTLHDSALPPLPNWVFDELKATGELSRDELRITDLDGRIKGGVLTGDVRINWRSGWRVQGELVAKVVPLGNINKLMTGDMDGTAHFQAQADRLSTLADAAIFNGVFNVKKGIIGGVDIVETTRLSSQKNLSGGRTHFDELSGELFYAKDAYRFTKLNIHDSVFQVNGALTVVGQDLSGRVSSNLTMRDGMSPVALQVSGTTESPSLHVEN